MRVSACVMKCVCFMLVFVVGVWSSPATLPQLDPVELNEALEGLSRSPRASYADKWMEVIEGAWSSPATLPQLDPFELNEALEGLSRSPRASYADKWMEVIEGLARSQLAEEQEEYPGVELRPFRLNLPDRSLRGRTKSLRVLVLPLAIESGSCSSKKAQRRKNYYQEEEDEDDEDEEEEEYIPPARAQKRPYRPAGRYRPPQRRRPSKPVVYESDEDEESGEDVPAPRRPSPPGAKKEYHQKKIHQQNIDSRFQFEETSPPVMPRPVSSAYLVQQYCSSTPTAPYLSPAVTPASPPTSPLGPAPAPVVPAASPPLPRWSRSMVLQGELTVGKADYTEPYRMWWDASSGTSRVEFHGGTTTTVTQQLKDGSYQRVEMSTDNTGGQAERRCAATPPQRLAKPDLAAPALPDLEQYQFAGYTETDRGTAEVWRRVVQGGAGQGGAARGEVLTYNHEVELQRDSTGDSVPLRYTVSVDSSALCRRVDGYEHRYTDVRFEQPDQEKLTVDLSRECNDVESLDISNKEHVARLAPLREFTLPLRDVRYDEGIEKFKAQFERTYMDDKEEAVRKTLFMQCSRFVNSGNRQGNTFSMDNNFLSDRLVAELDSLLGVAYEKETFEAEDFPHEKKELGRLEKELEDKFDWRDEGGVSHVRYQGSCSSCWAVAVTGAVEGALFRKTKQLVPLAEQTLVDCGHTFGTHGCNGTWPSFAYDYVQERGLPALKDYGPHKERVETCRNEQVSPVTHISAHVNVTKNSIPALKVAIRKHSPSVVIIDAKAKSFIFYKNGVLRDDRCGKQPPRLNHAVLAVGWSITEGAPHFIIKNSWSAAWGEAGYARLHAPSNACGVLALPSYPRLEKGDVDKLPNA